MSAFYGLLQSSEGIQWDEDTFNVVVRAISTFLNPAHEVTTRHHLFWATHNVIDIISVGRQNYLAVGETNTELSLTNIRWIIAKKIVTSYMEDDTTIDIPQMDIEALYQSPSSSVDIVSVQGVPNHDTMGLSLIMFNTDSLGVTTNKSAIEQRIYFSGENSPSIVESHVVLINLNPITYYHYGSTEGKLCQQKFSPYNESIFCQLAQ